MQLPRLTQLHKTQPTLHQPRNLFFKKICKLPAGQP
jgi:hypothetical protein